MATAYDDSNRAFVQAFLARNVLSFQTAKPLLAAILSVKEGREVLESDVRSEDFEEYLKSAQDALSPLDFNIRTCRHQVTEERQWALVNTTSDALTQLATTYSADEIAFVKLLLDAMFDGVANRGRKEAMCLSAMEAVQISRKGGRKEPEENGNTQATRGKLSMREAEDVLAKLLDEGWLEKSPKNFYSLSPRALMELQAWLVDTYNEPSDEGIEDVGKVKIRLCGACKDIVTVVCLQATDGAYANVFKGLRCSNRDCLLRLHERCVDAYFRKHQRRTCPLCQTQWDGKSYVGEKAITESESYKKGKRRSTNRPAEQVSDEEDGVEET